MKGNNRGTGIILLSSYLFMNIGNISKKRNGGWGGAKATWRSISVRLTHIFQIGPHEHQPHQFLQSDKLGSLIFRRKFLVPNLRERIYRAIPSEKSMHIKSNHSFVEDDGNTEQGRLLFKLL